MTPRTKWSLVCLAVQVPLHAAAYYWIGPWAVVPVLLLTNGVRIFCGPA